MGTRTVSVTLTFSVKGARNVTDSAWLAVEASIQDAVEEIVGGSLLTYPVNVETTYNRQVEVRPDYSLG